MIKLTKFTGDEFFLNPELITKIESGGDQVITLVNGDRFLVREKAEEIIEKIMVYKQKIHGTFPDSKLVHQEQFATSQ